jgi:hypothetical protein
MQRNSSWNRGRGQYGEHPDSAGREEYRGRNKRRNGLQGGREFSGRYREDEEYYRGAQDGNNSHYYQNEGYEYGRNLPSDDYDRNSYGGSRSGQYRDGRSDDRYNSGGRSRNYDERDSYYGPSNGNAYGRSRDGLSSDERRRRFSDRGYGYHYMGHNESENFGRRKESAFYDEDGPMHNQDYRGRGYFVRANEGEYEMGQRANFNGIKGFGRYNNDDERDYGDQNYRNMPSGFLY